MELAEAIQRLMERCSEYGADPLEALREKEIELALRGFFRCIPNDRLKEAQLETFLEEILGRAPDGELVESIREAKRGPRASDEEILELERQQKLRCAVCGRVLVRDAKPHVDHIVPVALRGKSELRNYQLLCEECNLGKAKWMHWIMAAPFFKDTGQSVTYGLRYAVLRRDDSRCTVPDCSIDAKSGALEVIPRVPVQNGGRLIFDNLRTVCESDARDIGERLYRQAMMKVRAVTYGVLRG